MTVAAGETHHVDGTEETIVNADGVPLSGILALPKRVPPRAMVVALHGGGVNARYFHGSAHPDVSLLTLGAKLGFSVLALDRPGYGRFADRFPQGQTLAEQTLILRTAIKELRTQPEAGAGIFLLAHSFGGKLALSAAADDRELLGLDISGLGHRYATDTADLGTPHERTSWKRNWGSLGLYPPGTFQSSGPMVNPMPIGEVTDAKEWPCVFGSVAKHIRIPVRLTFAEHEFWWRHDDQSLEELTSSLTNAPRVVVNHQPAAGHNISLGWAARPYHLRALAFLEDCLIDRET